MPGQLNSYADVKKLLNDWVDQAPGLAGRITGAPHRRFWNDLRYQDFVNGDVPNVRNPDDNKPIKILVKGASAASNLILALRGQGPLFDPTNGTIGDMPPAGPAMPAALIAELADWIDRNCPDPAAGGTNPSGGQP
jgi:hypothetical protein